MIVLISKELQVIIKGEKRGAEQINSMIPVIQMKKYMHRHTILHIIL